MAQQELRDDPRTASAVALWEGQHGRRFSPDPKAGQRFLGLMYPRESVHWIGFATDGASGRVLVAGFTAKRLVVSSTGWLSGSSAKAKHVVRHRVDPGGTRIWVQGASVPAAEWFVQGLPGDVLADFLAGRKPAAVLGAPSTSRSTAPVWGSPGPESFQPVHPPTRVPGTPAVASWQQAEELAGWHMRSLGFADARVTNAGTDGGIDVVAHRAVAQVKHYETSAIGRPTVQQLRGAAHNVDWALFYTRSAYTTGAVSYADEARVALFTYRDDGAVSAASDAARFLLESRTSEPDPRVGQFQQFMQARAQGQQALDRASTEYVDAMQAAVSRIPSAHRRKQATAFDVINREQAVVDGILSYVGGTDLPLGEVLRQCELIERAARRVRALRL